MNFTTTLAAASDALTIAASAHIKDTATFLAYLDKLMQPWIEGDNCKETTRTNDNHEDCSAIATTSTIRTHGVTSSASTCAHGRHTTTRQGDAIFVGTKQA